MAAGESALTWMGFIIQPTLSGAVFKVVDSSAAAIGVAVPGALGGRGSGKINVIWTPNFSSYLEVHGSGSAGTQNMVIPATQTYGAQAGLRYTW